MPEVFTISSPSTLHNMWRKVAPGNQVQLRFESVLLGKTEIDKLRHNTAAIVTSRIQTQSCFFGLCVAARTLNYW